MACEDWFDFTEKCKNKVKVWCLVPCEDWFHRGLIFAAISSLVFLIYGRSFLQPSESKIQG